MGLFMLEAAGFSPQCAQAQTAGAEPERGPRPFPQPTVPLSRQQTLPVTAVPARPLWTLQLNSSITTQPVADKDVGYFALDGDRIVAYSLLEGKRSWLVSHNATTDLALGDGLLFFGETGTIVALRTSDGSIEWQLPFADRLAVSLVWDNGWLVAATIDGAILAFRAVDGHLIWRADLGSAAHVRPTLARDRVYVPLEDGRVAALRVDTGATVWQHRLGGAAGEVLATDDRVFVGSRDNSFYCLDARDGAVRWRWRTGADVIGAPVTDGRQVFFIALDNVLRSLSLRSGVQQWRRPVPLRPTTGPVLAGNVLIVAGLAPTIYGYSVKDGTAAGELAAGGELAALPLVVDPTTVVGPNLLVSTRDIAQGARVTALKREIDLPARPMATLPNVQAVTPTLPASVTGNTGPQVIPLEPLPNPTPVPTQLPQARRPI
jgi:outer membrane protein assembly factor BamB